MIGKKNIVFGFLFLALTAALGPLMILKYVPVARSAAAKRQEKIGALQLAQENGFTVDLEKMTPEQIARADADALLALSAQLDAQSPIDAIKGGPHAHGNLEALLNIVVGIFIAFLAVPAGFKQTISWFFILGALGHSGLLYLAVALKLPWAQNLLASWFAVIGPLLLLVGLLLAGIAAAIGFNGTLVKDKAVRH